MVRWDEAAFVALMMIVAFVLALGLAELLAQALQPVSDALMTGTETITVEVTP